MTTVLLRSVLLIVAIDGVLLLAGILSIVVSGARGHSPGAAPGVTERVDEMHETIVTRPAVTGRSCSRRGGIAQPTRGVHPRMCGSRRVT